MIQLSEKETSMEFDLGSEFVIVVTGDNCVPCHMMQNALAKDSSIMGVPLYTIKADEVPELCASAQVMSVPTAIHIKNNVIKEKVVGYASLEKLEKEFIWTV